MSQVLSLHQLSAKTVIFNFCSRTQIGIHQYFDMLPLPVSMKTKLKGVCTNNIISDIIYRIMACNVWLEVQGNYHEERIRLYRGTLVNILDNLLPCVFLNHGLL